MSELTTASFKLAQRLHQRLKIKQRLAVNILAEQGGEVVRVHFEALFNDDDAKAIEDFEEHIARLQGLQKLPL
jgi:formylmethanofuran dehydrogenase subunit E